MNTRADAPSAARDATSFALALWQLTKPGVTRLVLVTCWLGAALADGPLQLRPALLTLLGTVLVVASANALNMVLEQEVDGRMQRTKDRPLPSGRLTRDVALPFGVALGVLGLLILYFFVNPLTTLLGAVSLFTYVLWYTPLKAKSSLALYVGAVPGAMPPVLGYTGVSGHLNFQAIALFLLMFVWQVPHFLAITIFRRDDYAAAGLQVMSVEQGIARTRVAIVISAFLAALTSLVPAWAGLGGSVYPWVAVISGAAFAFWAWFGQSGRAVEVWARTVFFASLPYIVLLFTVLAVCAA